MKNQSHEQPGIEVTLTRKDLSSLRDHITSPRQRNIFDRMISEYQGLKYRDRAGIEGWDEELPRRLAQLANSILLRSHAAADDCRVASLALVKMQHVIESRTKSEAKANQEIGALFSYITHIGGIRLGVSVEQKLKILIDERDNATAERDKARETLKTWSQRLCKSLSIQECELEAANFENVLSAIKRLKSAASTKSNQKPKRKRKRKP